MPTNAEVPHMLSQRDTQKKRGCYLGIDLGTQGLSIVLVDASAPDLAVVAIGEGSYGMIPGLPDDCYEQHPNDWTEALRSAAASLRRKLSSMDGREGVGAGGEKEDCGGGVGDGDGVERGADEWNGWSVLAIGISGQMHGEVLCDSFGEAVRPARLWCDSRNAEEGIELTTEFGTKIPKRSTAARWLWTTRNRRDDAARTVRITTPAGWIARRLTGAYELGVGEASGMFPIDQGTMTYDEEMLRKFDDLVASDSGGSEARYPNLVELLPTVRCAGMGEVYLAEFGADLLGLPRPAASSSSLFDDNSGDVSTGYRVPVAPAEGDQPAALAGSLISTPGDVACSFGTSVVANSVGNRPFDGIDKAVDHFCAPDGRPINMIWLRNGTTYMNEVVRMFGGDFSFIMPQVVSAPADCGGMLALPFMDDEPGLGVPRGGSGCLVNLTPGNVSNPGNAVKAAFLGTVFNLKMGTAVLDQQGYPRRRIYLSGGIAKTPELGQIVADAFEVPVTILGSAEEGTAWGAALLGAYQYLKDVERRQRKKGEGGSGDELSWSDFLKGVEHGTPKTFEPQSNLVAEYKAMYDRYVKLVGLVPQITEAVIGF